MSTSDVLVDVRESHKALYAAVVRLPFELTDALDAIDVDKCRSWYNDAAAAFNHARGACQNPIIPSAPVPTPITSFTGAPDYGRFGDGGFMESFENRVKAEAGNVPQHDARRYCLDMRVRALGFVEWIDKAVERVKSALLPAITVTPSKHKKGQYIVAVFHAGVPTEHKIGKTRMEQLRRLSIGQRVTFKNRSDITRDMPFLDGLLVDADPDKTLQRKLIPAMIGRITWQ